MVKRALIFWFVTGAAIAQPQTGGISGTVIDTVTHHPVKRATVQVSTNVRNAPSATTRSDGSFVLDSAPRGHLRVIASDPQYPQPGVAIVDVNAGEVTSGVTIEMTPGAIVSGHVVDEDGDPMPKCVVRAYSAAPPGDARASGNTDGSGEYRLGGLPSGKYLLAATCITLPFMPRPFSSGPDPPPSSAYPQQYYSGATDAKSAQYVTLAPGIEHSGVDFQMRPVLALEVRGTFSVAGSGRKGTDGPLNVILVSADSSVIRASDVNPGQGTFAFDRVFPGSYDLMAFSIPGPRPRVGGFTHVEVTDRPVEITLNLTPGADISGTVRLDITGSTITFNQITVQLQPAFPLGSGEFTDSVKPDGTFTIRSVLPGRWRLSAYNPYGGFVESAVFGDTDVSSGAFPFSGAGGLLRVVFSDRTGTIAGTARPGQMIRIRREGEQGGRAVGIDSSGHFRIDKLAPGTYLVMAREPNGSFIPQDEEGSQSVTVHESETVTIDFKQP